MSEHKWCRSAPVIGAQYSAQQGFSQFEYQNNKLVMSWTPCNADVWGAALHAQQLFCNRTITPGKL